MIKNNVIVLILILLVSCSKPTPKYFVSSELGWKVEIPKRWKVEDSIELKEKIKEAKKLIKTTGEDIKVTEENINLITFRKGNLSKFQATIIPFKEKYTGEWNDKYPAVKALIFNIFKSQNFSVDSTSSKESIDGVSFQVFNLKISQNHKLVMEQNMYRTYRNGYDFIITIASSNSRYKKQLIKALKASKFE